MSIQFPSFLPPADAMGVLPRNSALASSGLRTAGDGEACDEGLACSPIEGPTTLFAQGPGDAAAVDINDVKQRGFNDCYLMAAIGSLATTEQGRTQLQNMIVDNGDGTYTVTFQRYDEGGWFGIGSGWDDVQVTVNGDFPSQASGLSGDTNAQGEQEIWPQVLEKAYAQFIGGYSEFEADHNGDGKADGGNPGTAMEAFTGRSADHSDPSDYSLEELNEDFQSGQPIALLSPGGDKNGNLEGEAAQIAQDHGLHGFHSYSVMNVDTDTGMVELYNPWGDDVVTLPWSEAQKFFVDATTVPSD